MADRVLVIEDDSDVARALRTVLTRAQFDVTVATDGAEGLRSFHTHHADVVVLDVGLPDIDGWTVLARIRETSWRPVLMLTAHGAEEERVRGLRSGADDYLTKPFSNHELVARVVALIRRARAHPEPEDAIGAGPLVVHPQEHEIRVDGETVDLTPLEFELARVLAQHPGQVLTPRQLMEMVWRDSTGIAPDRVKFTLLRLRAKLGTRVRIESVRGVGYRYRPDPL